jgi:hypothetical protein
MITLGLDASTNVVGYAFLEDKKILTGGFIDISKQKTIKEKSYYVLDILEDMSYIIDDKVDTIVLEDTLSGFAFGRTRAQTVIKLIKFNVLFTYILEEALKLDIVHVNPRSARKNAFGRAFIKGVKPKDFVKENIERLYDTSKFTLMNKRKNWDRRNADMYDAIVCALWSTKQII